MNYVLRFPCLQNLCPANPRTMRIRDNKYKAHRALSSTEEIFAVVIIVIVTDTLI